MKTKYYHIAIVFAIIGAFIGVLMIVFPMEIIEVVPAIKAAVTRWGQFRAVDMILSDLVGVMLIAYVLISMLKSKTHDKN